MQIPVTQSVIKERALLVRNEILRSDDLGNAQRAQIESFTGSVGWCVNFVKRHGMKSIALHGRVEQWFDVKNNDDVREASISDSADDMEQLDCNPRSRY